MGKWTGKVGFAVNGEVEPGLWVDEVVEKVYKGELLSDRWRRQNSIGVNDNIDVYKRQALGSLEGFIPTIWRISFEVIISFLVNLSAISAISFTGTKMCIRDSSNITKSIP